MTKTAINQLIDEGLAAKTPAARLAWETKMDGLMKNAATKEEFEETAMAFMAVLIELGESPTMPQTPQRRFAQAI